MRTRTRAPERDKAKRVREAMHRARMTALRRAMKAVHESGDLTIRPGNPVYELVEAVRDVLRADLEEQAERSVGS